MESTTLLDTKVNAKQSALPHLVTNVPNSQDDNSSLPRSPDNRRGLERLLTKKLNEVVTSERCPDCGVEITFPNLQVRYVYQSCPHCEFQLKPATTLSIPPPHKYIPDKNIDNRCLARVFNHGQGGRCSRTRSGKLDFCRFHARKNKSKDGLPYGRVDVCYDQPHPLPEFDKEAAAQELTVSLLPKQGAARRQKKTNKSRGALSMNSLVSGDAKHADLGSDDDDDEEYGLELVELSKTHDAIVMAKKRELENQKVDDSILLSHANKLVQRAVDKSKITTEFVCQNLEPTFGVDLRNDATKIEWVRSHVEALLSVPSAPLTVLAAAFGHPREAVRAVNVERELNAIIKRYAGTRLLLEETFDLLSLCDGVDPCPGEDKVLRVRYNMYGHRGEVAFGVPRNRSTLDRPLDIHLFTQRPRLSLIRAMFGHPNDITKTFDVTEQVQGMADQGGEGELLRIGVDEDNLVNFRDPCIGVVKTLKIKYEILPERHDAVFHEANDYLLSPVEILAPIVSPLLLITSAKLTSVHFNPRKTVLANTKIAAGHASFTRRASSGIEEECLDVSEQIQDLVDNLGGDMLQLQKNECISSVLGLNKTFLRNRAKKLYVDYVAHGKQAHLILDINMNDLVQRDVFIDARPILPTIIIHGAVYGHPTNPSLRTNVQEVLDCRVRHNAGRVLQIGTNESLKKLFGGDPCFPAHVNKVLLIKYEIRKLSGEIGATVQPDGFLRQSIAVGWPKKVYGRNFADEAESDTDDL